MVAAMVITALCCLRRQLMTRRQYFEAPGGPYYGGAENSGYVISAHVIEMPTTGNANPYLQPGYPAGVHQQPYGQQLYNTASVIVGQPGISPPSYVELPQNHSTLAWLTCMFCFWPLGIAAIVKSNEVNTAISQGDIARARNASNSARKFGYWSLGIGLVLFVTVIVVYFAVFYFNTNKTYTAVSSIDNASPTVLYPSIITTD